MEAKRDILLAPLRAVNAAVNEKPWKNRLRAQLLNWRNALPRELMVRRGDVVVQVGMWRPRNVERLSRCVGGTGKVVLIEADSRNADRLRSFLRSKAIENVTLVEKAAWNQPGTFDLCIAHDPANNRLDVDNVTMLGEMNRDAFAEMKSIQVDTLDHILAELSVDRVDYAEISVNGVELQVLQGMQESLPNTRRIFVAGYAHTKTEGEPLNRCSEAFLRQNGFRTKITSKSSPTQADFDGEAARQWGDQEGHIFAWRE